MTIYSAGLRISELLGLEINDPDPDRMQIRVRQSKGRKDRYTILSQRVIALLHKYISAHNPRAYLFEGQYGGKYSASSVQKIWKRALQGAGIPGHFNFHCLRHSFSLPR